MNVIQNKPSSAASMMDENAILGGKSLKGGNINSLKSLKGTFKQPTSLCKPKEDCFVKPSASINTPRRKLGNVSNNTPIASSKKQGGGLAKPEQGFFQKPTPASGSSKKGPSLPTVYEDIEKMFPLSAKERRDAADPLMVAGLYERDLSNVPFDDKENQPISLDDILELL